MSFHPVPAQHPGVSGRCLPNIWRLESLPRPAPAHAHHYQVAAAARCGHGPGSSDVVATGAGTVEALVATCIMCAARVRPWLPS
jgi:hypothetical protein